MGGSSVARSALVGDEGSDPEGDGEHDDDDGASAGDVAVTVEDADDEPPSGGDDDGAERGHRRAPSASDGRPRPRERLATIPSPAAPFGLMARMTLEHRPLRKMKSKSSIAEDEEEEDVGLANPDFFRASAYPCCSSLCATD